MEIALDILSLLYILATNILLCGIVFSAIICSKICIKRKQRKQNLVFNTNLDQQQNEQTTSNKSKNQKKSVKFLSKQNIEEANQELLGKDSIYHHHHHHPQQLEKLESSRSSLKLQEEQEQFGLSTSRSSRSEIFLEVDDDDDSPQMSQSFSSSSLNESGNLNESYSLSSIDLSDTDSNRSEQLPQERDMKYKIRRQRNTIKKSGKNCEKLKFLCRVGDRELSSLTSLDSYLYLAYLKFCAYFFLFLSIPSCILLLPIYIQPKENDDKSYQLFTLDNMTIANIFQNQNRMIIVALFVLTYSFMNYSFIYNYAQRVQNKQYFSLSRQHHGDSQFSNHALMIKRLPKRIKTINGSNQVFQFFRTKFRDQVVSANVIPSYQKLMNLNQKLQKLIRKLKSIYNAQGFDNQVLYLTCCCCCKNDDDQQYFIESSFAKKIYSIFCCCCTNQSLTNQTAYQLYRQQKDQIQIQIKKINQTQVYAQSNCGIAFVTFQSEDSMRAALDYIQQFQISELAGKGYQQSNLQAQYWDVSQAPAPSDIIWDTLCKQNQKFLKCRRCYLNFFLAILAAALILPPSIIDRIASISYIEQSQKKIYNSSENTSQSSDNGLFFGYLQLYFTPILSVLITTIVIPWLIYKIAMYDSHQLKSLRARSILRKNFIFIGLSTIILPIVGFAITISCLELEPSIEGIVSSVFAQELVNQMSRSSDFFLRYIIQLTFYFNIILIVGVPLYTKKMQRYQKISTFQPSLQGELTQKKIKKNFAVRTLDEQLCFKQSWFFQIGHSKVISMAIYIIVLSLSVITPLVVPIGCFFFTLKYFTDKWNIMFVSLKRPQSDGTIRQFLITYSIISILLFQFLMAILFILTLNTILIIVGVSLIIIGSIIAVLFGKRWGGGKKKQHYTKKSSSSTSVTSIQLNDINSSNMFKMQEQFYSKLKQIRTARQVYPELQERLKEAYIHPLQKQRPPPGYQHHNKKKLKLNFNRAPKSAKQQPRQQKKLSHSPRLIKQIHGFGKMGEPRKAKRDLKL